MGRRSNKPHCRYFCKNEEKVIYQSFSTYKELKKNLMGMFDASYDDTLSITRTRRGEWGEWFENWVLVDGKPKIEKQGWL